MTKKYNLAKTVNESTIRNLKSQKPIFGKSGGPFGFFPIPERGRGFSVTSMASGDRRKRKTNTNREIPIICFFAPISQSGKKMLPNPSNKKTVTALKNIFRIVNVTFTTRTNFISLS